MKIIMPAAIKGGFEDIEVELLDIGAHLANVASFALHKGLESDGFYKSYWFVSNVETGLWTFYDSDKKEAIRKTVERLEKETPTSIVRRMHKGLRNYGLKP